MIETRARVRAHERRVVARARARRQRAPPISRLKPGGTACRRSIGRPPLARHLRRQFTFCAEAAALKVCAQASAPLPPPTAAALDRRSPRHVQSTCRFCARVRRVRTISQSKWSPHTIRRQTAKTMRSTSKRRRDKRLQAAFGRLRSPPWARFPTTRLTPSALRIHTYRRPQPPLGTFLRRRFLPSTSPLKVLRFSSKLFAQIKLRENRSSPKDRSASYKIQTALFCRCQRRTSTLRLRSNSRAKRSCLRTPFTLAKCQFRVTCAFARLPHSVARLHRLHHSNSSSRRRRQL